MKMFICATVLLLGACGSAHAIPVTYSFTSTWSFEADSLIGPPPLPLDFVAPDDRLFAPADTFSGVFVYDSETAPLISNTTLAIYRYAVTDFAATVRQHDILASTASATLIAAFPRLVFAGGTNALTIGDWTSTSITLSWGNYPSLILPGMLPPSDTTGLVSLNFNNSQNTIQRQVAFGSVVITRISEPSIGLLLLMGLLATVAYSRRARTAQAPI